MSRRHTLAFNGRDKKWSTPRKKNGLTGRGGGPRDISGQKATLTSRKHGYGADRGLEKVEKLDTEAEREVDDTMWERTEAGGSGTEAKKDTSTAH